MGGWKMARDEESAYGKNASHCACARTPRGGLWVMRAKGRLRTAQTSPRVSLGCLRPNRKSPEMCILFSWITAPAQM